MAASQRKPLKEACVKIGSGATPRGGKEAYRGGATALIRSQNVYNDQFSYDGLAYIDDVQAEELANVVVCEGDVLLNITGDSVARCCRAPADVIPARVNQHVAIIRPDASLLHAGFLRYVLVSPEYQHHLLALASAGATRNALTKGMIEALEVPLPPIPEQQRIAHILGTLDDKIELNRRMNATLEGISRALFKSWFVDFDPVRQKAAGKQPVGMDAKTAALFPDSFEDSEIGEVPKGWEVGSILEQASLLSGGTPKTDEPSYWGGCIPWASAKDVSQCGEAFLTATERGITQAGVDNSSTKIIPAYTTVIVSRGATTGRLTMLAGDMAMNQTCYGLHSRIDTPLSLYCCAQSFITRMVAAAHGSVFDTITTKTFETTPVLLVPPRNLVVFEETVAGVFARVRKNLMQSRTLAALRDTLLPKLLSGEIRVSEAEEIVEESVR